MATIYGFPGRYSKRNAWHLRTIVKIHVLLLSLSPLFMGCNTTTAHSKNAPLSIKKKPHAGVDSVAVEPQTTHIAYGDLPARVTRVVSYSYLDVEDYEEDTFSREIGRASCRERV